MVTDFCDTNEKDRNTKLLAFCEQFGSLIPHNAQSDSIIWDIKTNDKTYSYKTFSSHNAEAQLHTDSAFSKNPEDIFILLVVKSARCKGGESILLHLEKLLEHIHALPDGYAVEQTLRENVYPFAVPDVFKKSLEDELEYATGPILYDDKIRFRSDSIRQCLKFNPELLNHKQHQALDAIDEILSNPAHYQRLYLNDNDLIIIDNKRMLHGRTAFTDKERHVLRVRMSSDE